MAGEYVLPLLETALIDALKADSFIGLTGVVAGRVYPRKAPTNTAYPFVVVSTRAPRPVVANGGIEVMTTYPALVSIYGRSPEMNATLTSRAKVIMDALGQTQLPGGAILSGATIDPRPSAVAGSGADAQGVLLYSDHLSYLVYIEPVQP